MNHKILIVEDNIIAQRITKLIINSLGDEAVIVNSGLQALQELQNHHYDLAIMDIGLPDVDGITIMETLRECGNNTPVIGLTAHDEVTDDTIFAKPFTRTLYQNILCHLTPPVAEAC